MKVDFLVITNIREEDIREEDVWPLHFLVLLITCCCSRHSEPQKYLETLSTTIQAGMASSIMRGKLSVTIAEARNIRNSDHAGTYAPFITLKIGEVGFRAWKQ